MAGGRRENQVGQLVLQAAASHGQAVGADLTRGVTLTQIQASPEQLSLHDEENTPLPASPSPPCCLHAAAGD